MFDFFTGKDLHLRSILKSKKEIYGLWHSINRQ
jgi:hypothetical protein